MSLKIFGLALSFALTSTAFAFNTGTYFHKRSLLLNSQSPENAHLKLRPDGSLRVAEVGFFDQKLNHKAAASKTFKQRFFIDSQYAKNSDSPVFYIICGEWNCAGTSSYSFVESMAKNFKAHLVALEHRFYGESLPSKVLTPKALTHLNLQAAIDDLAAFQIHLMQNRGLKGKWVTFGGSYAGTLSAFYREKHPELVVGALASSAPVFMKNEFSEYDAHIAKVINKSSCGDKVREAVKLIEEEMQTPEGSLKIKQLFQASNVKNDKDFLYVVADMLAAAVQYGKDKVFCDALSNNSDPITGYAQGGLSVLRSMGSTPFDISLAVAENENVTADDNMRQWMWQSCREFGWFQVANGTGHETSRSSKIDLQYHDEVCMRLYKKNMGKDGALNKKWFHPLYDVSTSNIIFTNGANDPWLTLSVTEFGPTQAGFDLFMMDGAAHCNDLRISSLPAVLNAHGKIKNILQDWLK